MGPRQRRALVPQHWAASTVRPRPRVQGVVCRRFLAGARHAVCLCDFLPFSPRRRAIPPATTSPESISAMLDGSGTGAKMTSWWSRLSITSIGRTGAAPSPPSQLDASVSAPVELALPPLKRAAPPERSYGPAVVSYAISQTAIWNAASSTLVSTTPATLYRRPRSSYARGLTKTWLVPGAVYSG